ncbi:amino acid permease [Bifidobacterium scaligerum]|uniref:Amino acid ABC transporter permease n=1 Tax=Bifidobacterium scaligerum TaxID=2052656 RepID=A0A2M9HN24_9BIFI|nr:amino acid permease [Bifidobacterium scaligerum]PJM78224.1 amino acid ABC transporter permease [Bifidobacterium scaligerum]
MSSQVVGERIQVSGATYTRTSADFFKKRQLRRAAGAFGLWGLGIAAVVSGDFTGWNGGIGQAGWGGMLIATVIVYGMYWCMLNSIAEMASAMPHTGGAYSFARAAMGPWGGIVTGLAETIEYVMANATTVYFASAYFDEIVRGLSGYSLDEHGLRWVWWLAIYAVFVAINWLGASTSFRFAEVISIISLAIIAIFGFVTVFSGKVNFTGLFDISPASGGSTFLPFGIGAIFFAMPFAMWLYLGIEQLPLSAEEAYDPEHNIPIAARTCIVTLGISSLVVLILNPAIIGSKVLGSSDEPLLDGFRAVFSDQFASLLAVVALIGLLASIQGAMYAYGRNLYSLSRAGYYPHFLSLTGTKHKTPYWGLITGALIGFVALLLVNMFGDGVGSVVLNISVWGAVLAYLLQMVSYILLRKKLPDIERPFISKLGVAGAVFGGLVALCIFIATLLNPAYRMAVYVMVAIYVVILAIFALWGRKHLILSPEEEFAISGGELGNPSDEETDEAKIFASNGSFASGATK